MCSPDTQLRLYYVATFCVVSSFTEFLPFIFKIKGVTCFLSEKLSQDLLEKFFGCQRQKGRANENPMASKFLKNTQSLRVIDSICIQHITGQLTKKLQGDQKKELQLRESLL